MYCIINSLIKHVNTWSIVDKSKVFTIILEVISEFLNLNLEKRGWVVNKELFYLSAVKFTPLVGFCQLVCF